MEITEELLLDKQKQIEILREEESKLADIITRELDIWNAMNDLYVAESKLAELKRKYGDKK